VGSRLTRDRVARGLTWSVGIVFVALGVVEVAVRLLSDEPVDRTAIIWWAGSLIGGGLLLLVGRFGMRRHPGLGTAMFVIGCALGILATA